LSGIKPRNKSSDASISPTRDFVEAVSISAAQPPRLRTPTNSSESKALAVPEARLLIFRRFHPMRVQQFVEAADALCRVAASTSWLNKFGKHQHLRHFDAEDTH
jgi:hypothetical protein